MMIALGVLFLIDIVWGLSRTSMALSDFYATEFLTELTNLNAIIEKHVKPSAPYRSDIDAVRADLAEIGDN